MSGPVTAPARLRSLRRLPAEWFFAAAFAAVGVWVYLRTPIQWTPFDVAFYRALALAFGSGFVVMIAVAYGASLLRNVSAPDRSTCTWTAGALALLATLALYLLIHTRGPAHNRLLEAAAFSSTLVALGLTIFLPVAGLVRPHHVARALTQALSLWGPILVYHVFAGFCLTANQLATPFVWDPVLLRMDLSLGFNASQIAHAWHYHAPWIRQFSYIGYALLGLMIALVIARLQIARAWAHARRALLASFLVGVLGLGCYQLVPAIGPIYAFPALYRDLDERFHRFEAGIALEEALTGPDRVRAAPRRLRNAMPSLHTAWALVSLASAWHWRRRFFWWCLPLGILQIATTLTLGYHYLVDLLAAVPLAVFCWWIADRAIRLTPRPTDEPLPVAPRVRWRSLSLFASVGALLAWAALAPLSPWLAWPLATLVVAVPCYPALAGFCATRLSREPPSPRSLSRGGSPEAGQESGNESCFTL